MTALPSKSKLLPLECTLFPSINITSSQDQNENQDAYKAWHAECLEHHSPRKKKDYLDVEQDKQHRNQIKPDIKTIGGQLEGCKPAFKRSLFDLVRFLWP